MKLLLFTVNANTGNTVRTILADENISAHIVSAKSHEQTLENLMHDSFDMVIIESTAQSRNGLELLKKIKMHHPTIPVLMLSLNNTRAFAVQAMRLNAQGFLSNDRIASEIADAVKSIQLGRCYMTTELTA